MSQKKFETFEGVFTPCLLSILGVIMYLRLGWVVGHAGLGGALIIIGLANLITVLTALSMSSIVTNIRIGDGGAYSIITKSLGIEAGGAIGLPLYISQAVSVAFYVAGFSECWIFVFPEHNALLVSLIAWLILSLITFLSTTLAFRVQYVIITIIVLSLVSIVFGKGDNPAGVQLWATTNAYSFWQVFSIFFPAVTGILAGASMSGELKDPKRSIPLGTMSAIGVSLVVYCFLAMWMSMQVGAEELRTNNNIAIELGRWPYLVIGGIMGATFSSGLAMFVGAPRVLLALGKNAIIPFGRSMSRINSRGEPAAAILFTSLIALITILNSNLNQIAGLLTMIFLITYGMINLTVFIEQSMGIISFRPSFRIPKLVPFSGSVGCIVVMFLINPKFGLIAILLVIAAYFILIKRGASNYSPDIRSGLMVFLAEQLAKMANALPYYPKIWKPNLLVPIRDFELFKSVVHFLGDIVYPAGRVTAFKIVTSESGQDRMAAEETTIKKQNSENLSNHLECLKEKGIFVESTVVESPEYLLGTDIVMQTVQGMFFPPNALFQMLPDETQEDEPISKIIESASGHGLGIVILKYDQRVGFSQQKIINLWIRQQSPNINLSVLLALQLERNWEGQVRIIQIVEHEHHVDDAKKYLLKIKELMRMTHTVEVEVLIGDFHEIIKEAPAADINIFGMQEKPDISLVRQVAVSVKTSVLFLRDSKYESALA